MFKGKEVKEVTNYNNEEALIKKYNALIRFATEKTIVTHGCLNYPLTDIHLLEDSILIIWNHGRYQYSIKDPKDIVIDRKYKMIELHVQ